MDACVGNLRQLYARGQTFSYDQSDIGEYYLQYLRMMDHWDEVLPGKVLRVQYEDVVTDLEARCGACWNTWSCPGRKTACAFMPPTGRAHRQFRAGAPADLRLKRGVLAALRVPLRRTAGDTGAGAERYRLNVISQQLVRSKH